MNRCLVLAMLALACGAMPAAAAEEKCPLAVGACLEEFHKMKSRPWLGIRFDRDSTTGFFRIQDVVPGSPAHRGGLKAGDELMRLNGEKIGEQPKLIVGKAGWRTGDDAVYRVRRRGQEQDVKVTLGTISDEMLAEMIGVHMMEGHLAWMDEPPDQH